MTDATFDHSGSSFDDFLVDEGLLDDAEAAAVRRVIAWQIADEMRAHGMDREAMAARMRSSVSELDRLLEAEGREMDVSALTRAARALGKRLRIDMVDAA